MMIAARSLGTTFVLLVSCLLMFFFGVAVAANIDCSGSGQCNGTNQADFIVGNGQSNNIDAKDGGDTAYGLQDQDSVSGEEGQDFVTGGDGGDTVHGNGAGDTAGGASGGDDVHGDDGADILADEEGIDQVYGGGQS